MGTSMLDLTLLLRVDRFDIQTSRLTSARGTFRCGICVNGASGWSDLTRAVAVRVDTPISYTTNMACRADGSLPNRLDIAKGCFC